MRYISRAILIVFFCALAPAFGAECSISSGDMNFGIYDPLGATVESQGDLRVVCKPDLVPFEIAMTVNKMGPGGERTLKSGGASVPYYIFVDSARTLLWGDGTRGTATYLGVGGNVEVTIPVFGRLPTGPILPAGTYTDAVRVFVNF